jgi:biofilm protein TabA
MNFNFANKPCVFSVLFLVAMFSATAQTEGQWPDAEASKWFRAGAWLGGLKLRPSPTIDKKVFVKEYHARKAWWDKAIRFMSDRKNDTLAPGTYPIDGENVFAKVSEIPGKTEDEAKWEAHDHYFDIHYVIQGKESMGIGQLSGARIIIPYEAQRDITFYEGSGKYYTMAFGEFFIVGPHQIHRPALAVKGYNGKVKKIVIKVRREE